MSKEFEQTLSANFPFFLLSQENECFVVLPILLVSIFLENKLKQVRKADNKRVG